MSFLGWLAVQLIAAVVEYVLTPTPRGPKPGISTTPTSQQGTPRRVIFGDVWVADTFIGFWGNQRQTPIKAGGKK